MRLLRESGRREAAVRCLQHLLTDLAKPSREAEILSIVAMGLSRGGPWIVGRGMLGAVAVCCGSLAIREPVGRRAASDGRRG